MYLSILFMQKIAIIGVGFTGTMTAVQLIRKSIIPLKIILIDGGSNINKGIAYSSYSNKHLLNVIASRMSALPDLPDHFVDWVIQNQLYPTQTKETISDSFLPRNLYGEYLSSIWEEAKLLAIEKNIDIDYENNNAIDICEENSSLIIHLENGKQLLADQCVLSTGNQIPGNPEIQNQNIFLSEKYFQNPWTKISVENTNSNLPVLIIGNGLTMVDSVIGLIESGFKGKIISISPHGFNILRHKNYNPNYDALINEWKKCENKNLHELVILVNRHIKKLRISGLSPEPVIDSLRSLTPEIWSGFSDTEKKIFMSRLRHMWGVARHRIPAETHEIIINLRKEKRLEIIAGKITDIQETDEGINMAYLDKKSGVHKVLSVAKIINCTGPQTDISRSDNKLLKNLLLKGWIQQDELKLGLLADSKTYRVIDGQQRENSNIFTIGVNLKGVLWESTAVNEIRKQTKELATILLIR